MNPKRYTKKAEYINKWGVRDSTVVIAARKIHQMAAKYSE